MHLNYIFVISFSTNTPPFYASLADYKCPHKTVLYVQLSIGHGNSKYFFFKEKIFRDTKLIMFM